MATEKKVAIVTGASKGIGAGIAKALAAEGYVVVVNYASSKTDADKVVGEIERAGGKALAIHADVSKQAEIKQLFSETLKAFGYLNVLINNAAVYGPSPLDAITEEHFHWMFNVNVLGLTFATQEAVKAFGDKGGSIVKVGSTVTRIPSPGFSIYSATKAAVESLASDRPLHILVNDAGIMAAPLQHDRRGYESHFSINHLGHFQLTVRLLPAPRRAKGARVVSVSSWGIVFHPFISKIRILNIVNMIVGRPSDSRRPQTFCSLSSLISATPKMVSELL